MRSHTICFVIVCVAVLANSMDTTYRKGKKKPKPKPKPSKPKPKPPAGGNGGEGGADWVNIWEIIGQLQKLLQNIEGSKL